MAGSDEDAEPDPLTDLVAGGPSPQAVALEREMHRILDAATESDGSGSTRQEES